MRSIRARLLSGTATVAVLVLLASGFAVFAGVRSHLYDEFDRALLEKVRLLAATVEEESGIIDLGFLDLDLTEFERGENPSYLQLRLANGFSLYRSPSLENEQMPFVAGEAEPQFGRAMVGDTRTRAVVYRFAPRAEGEELPGGSPGSDDGDHVDLGGNAAGVCVLMLARPVDRLHGFLTMLQVQLLLAGLAGIGALLLLLRLVVAGGLRPVHRIANEIAALDPADLARRIDDGGAPSEILPVVERLNELLARLEQAFERERGLSADIAHELRTPVAGLRATIEVSLSRSRDQAGYRDALVESLTIVRGLDSMIERLLWLFRLETDQVRPEAGPVDLAKGVADGWLSLEDRAEGGFRIETDLDSAVAWVDAELLRLAIRNVLENAFLYTPRDGYVRIATSRVNGFAELLVRNSAPRLAEHEIESLFDRFVRGDAARAGQGLHVGLGLPLVKEVCEATGGSVTAECTNGEFLIRLSFPARD